MVTFTARWSEPELVYPARPTPRETKALSDLDDQWSLRFYESIVGFFRSPPGESTKPARPSGQGHQGRRGGGSGLLLPHGRAPEEAPRRKQARGGLHGGRGDVRGGGGRRAAGGPRPAAGAAIPVRGGVPGRCR
uniref:Uncharacterized protein n=1 Tax=Aegilops tauschii TaxID=37682 RepID=M8BK38_AEGTA